MGGCRKDEVSCAMEDRAHLNSEKEKVNPSGSEGVEVSQAKRRRTRRSKLQALQEEIEKLTEEKELYRDRWLRTAAELDNYRKIVQREFEKRLQNAQEELITELLPVLDDFERSLEIGKRTRSLKKFYQGIDLIYRKFKKVLEGYGLRPIESVGKPFDVNLHEALMTAESEDYPPNTVIEEHQKGYMLHDRVIRHAKVVVSK